MNKKILIVHTSWYEQYISEMLNISKEILKNFDCAIAKAPGALELAPLASYKLRSKDTDLLDESIYSGVLFLGVVIRGETSHYDLVTKETFKAINSLAMEYARLSFINNVFCVENKEQLEARLIKTTTNNAKALIQLMNEKSS